MICIISLNNYVSNPWALLAKRNLTSAKLKMMITKLDALLFEMVILRNNVPSDYVKRHRPKSVSFYY